MFALGWDNYLGKIKQHFKKNNNIGNHSAYKKINFVNIYVYVGIAIPKLFNFVNIYRNCNTCLILMADDSFQTIRQKDICV